MKFLIVDNSSIILANHPSITNPRTNIPSPFITKLLFFGTASITLAQYSIYHNFFKAQSPISCDHKVSDCLDCFLVRKYGRITLLLIAIYIPCVIYANMTSTKFLKEEQLMPLKLKWLQNLH